MIDSVGLGIYLLFALSYFLFIFALVVVFLYHSCLTPLIRRSSLFNYLLFVLFVLFFFVYHLSVVCTGSDFRCCHI